MVSQILLTDLQFAGWADKVFIVEGRYNEASLSWTGRNEDGVHAICNDNLC